MEAGASFAGDCVKIHAGHVDAKLLASWSTHVTSKSQCSGCYVLCCLSTSPIQVGSCMPLRAKPGTAMALYPEPPLEELLWTVAVARILFGPTMNIQAPPNLTNVEQVQQQQQAAVVPVPVAQATAEASGSSDSMHQQGVVAAPAGWCALLDAGINDWGESCCNCCYCCCCYCGIRQRCSHCVCKLGCQYWMAYACCAMWVITANYYTMVLG